MSFLNLCHPQCSYLHCAAHSGQHKTIADISTMQFFVQGLDKGSQLKSQMNRISKSVLYHSRIGGIYNIILCISELMKMTMMTLQRIFLLIYINVSLGGP